MRPDLKDDNVAILRLEEINVYEYLQESWITEHHVQREAEPPETIGNFEFGRKTAWGLIKFCLFGSGETPREAAEGTSYVLAGVFLAATNFLTAFTPRLFQLSFASPYFGN